MTPSFSRVFFKTGLVHGVLLAVFVIPQWLLSRPRPLQPQEQVTFVDLSGGGGGGDDAGPPRGPTPPPVGRPSMEEVLAELKRIDQEALRENAILEAAAEKDKDKVQNKDKNTDLRVPPPKTNTLAQVKGGKAKLTRGQIRDLLARGLPGVGGGSSSGRGGGRVGSGSGSGSGYGTGSGADSPGAWYYAMVRQVMYDAWEVPGSLAAQTGLSAEVMIRVLRDGTITERKMTRPAGNAVWDESVNKAVNSVRRLRPLPPEFIGANRDILILFEPTSAML
ncbi:MAG: energy transducer TonB [Kiritimatiellaeota bacterium]|nr:energy transducer TonB [Kiritimatiellota bacterium]